MFTFMCSILRIMFRYAPFYSCIKIIESSANALMPPLILFFTQNVLNSVEIFINKTTSAAETILWTILLIAALIISASSNILNGLLDIAFRKKLNTVFAAQILDKYERIAYECFEDSAIQDTFERMGSNPQDKILESFYTGIKAVQLIITVIGLALIFLQIHWLTSIIFFLILSFIMFFDYRSMNMMNTMFNHQTTDERKMHYYGSLLSEKNTLFELRLFSAVGYIQALWKKKTEQVLSLRLRTTLKVQCFFAASTMCLLSWLSFILFILIQGVIHRHISIGTFIALLGSASSVLSYTETISYTFSKLSQNYLHLRSHYQTFMALPERVSGSLLCEGDDLSIVFDHVSFTYPHTDIKVLDDISFTIKCGERIALVGANGAGKSTIIKLLCRLYEPDSGIIHIGNKNIRDISDEALHKILSAVFQDFVNYSLTVRENVAVGNIEKLYDDHALLSALENAHAIDFIGSLDTPLGKIVENSVDLSGGQWQRIAIARAFIAETAFIILDEPTASLDPIAESTLYADFITLMQKKGCIVVSHRLASAKQADRILVIDRGKLIEDGTHMQLLQKGGLYTRMWEAQSSWYLE